MVKTTRTGSQNEFFVRRLLIVDDDSDFVESLLDILGPRGYELATAPNARSALETAKDFRAHAALVDLKLPDGSGTALIADLKRVDQDCVCIMTTAYADVNSAVDALAKGAFHYLQKPYRPEELLGLLDRVFEIVRLREEKRRAEEDLKYQKTLLEAQNEASIDGILVVDADGRILSFNRRFVEMWNIPDEVLRTREDDRALASVLDELEDPEGFLARVRYLYEHEDERSRDEIHLKGGRWFDRYSAPVRSAEGKTYGRVWFFRDVTDRKRAEEERVRLDRQVQQAQRLESLGVMAGGIAHDFNNLLMGILANADLALLKLAPESVGREFVEKIVTAAERAADLTNQMLAYSGRGHFLIGALDLNHMVRQMSHLLQTVISKKARLELQLAEGLPGIEGDASQVHQVVMNLVTNASEAIGDETGVVRLRTGVVEANQAYLSEGYLGEELPAGRYLYLEVNDTGAGMDRETLQKIFDPFFTTKFTGRGLGLAAVLGIVRGHRGTIKVSSELGRGTTFTVLFPSHEASLRRAVPEPTVVRGAPGAATVLVVDDEPSVLDVAQGMLESAGFQVLTARDGQDGVDVFRRHRDNIAVVVLDMTMPRMDGEQAFHEMRRIRPDVQVVLSSGYTEREATNRFAGKGLAGFIQKPYRTAKLLERIHGVLERS